LSLTILPLSNTAIHLTRHRRITTPMGSLLPQVFAYR
jgi:hypothetical protein